MKRVIPRLVLATHNDHKVREIKAILRKGGLKLHILTLKDFPPVKPVVENRRTIEGNARKKAWEVAQHTRCLALADDTGLFINGLGGDPGVYSARFAGRGCSFQDNNRKVLRLLKGKPTAKRTAVFRCIAALANADGRVMTAEGRISGRITDDIKGKNGFGYDPIFYVPRFKKTFAEMGSHLKNRISHRGKAFSKIPSLLKQIFRENHSI